jgi:polyisoprenoid-binding protein YceI
MNKYAGQTTPICGIVTSRFNRNLYQASTYKYATMKLHNSTIICLSLVVSTIVSAAPITLHIDNTHSSIQFTVPFLAISEVTGRFERFCGNFVFDEPNITSSRLELFIDASSINTGLKIRDRDLVEKYLETKTYPVIYFKSKSIRLTRPKYYEVTGDLHLHGVSKELRVILTVIGDVINGEKARELGFKLQELKLNRTDYGILEGAMGSGSVGDTVTISSVIRVRDVTPYRNGLDTQYPEKKSPVTFPFSGSFKGVAGENIKLIEDKGNYFLAFSDDDWSWFAQAKLVGPDLYKLLSFGTLVEVKSKMILFTKSGEQPTVLTAEELK